MNEPRIDPATGRYDLDDLYYVLEHSGQMFVPPETVSGLRRRAQQNGLRLATRRRGPGGQQQVWLTTDGVHIWTYKGSPDALVLHDLLVWHQLIEKDGRCTCGHEYQVNDSIQEHVVQVILDAGFHREPPS
jgi:hypothetical protein